MTPVSADVKATATEAAVAPASTYGRLLRTPGLRSLLVSSLLTRTASQMWTVGLVLFALQRYHSAGVAGSVHLPAHLSGTRRLSPIAGALLDRHGRKRLMRLDFSVAALCLTAIVTLAATNHLPVWGLYALLVAGSLTSTLSLAGARSFFPLIVPRDLWDRGNAADSICFGVSAILGPALAGFLIATLGSEAALAGAAVCYVIGAFALQGVIEPAGSGEVSSRILYEALRGLRYVVANRTLRWIAVSMSILNVGWGMVIVALPSWCSGSTAAPPSSASARAQRSDRDSRRAVRRPCAHRGTRARSSWRSSARSWDSPCSRCCSVHRRDRRRHRDRRCADGRSTSATFSLRQRRTARAWFGRAFAVSMASTSPASRSGRPWRARSSASRSHSRSCSSATLTWRPRVDAPQDPGRGRASRLTITTRSARSCTDRRDW